MNVSASFLRVRKFTGELWTMRIGVLLLVMTAAGFIWMSNRYLSDRYIQAAQNEIEHQLAVIGGKIVSELNRMSLVPLHLSRDSSLIEDLVTKSFARTSVKLFDHQKTVGSKNLHLLNDIGRLVATTERERLTEIHNERAFFVNAVRSEDTVFSSEMLEDRIQRHFYSRRIEHDGKTVGVVVVEINLGSLFETLPDQEGIIFATDSSRTILFSTESRFHGKTEEEALADSTQISGIRLAIRKASALFQAPVDVHFRGQSFARVVSSIPFQGWRLVKLSGFASARAKINQILALEITAFAILLSSLIFWLLHRQQFRLKIESRELRLLNARLEREIAERKRTEKDLEQTRRDLAKSEKLAAMGELSAIVGHELNQPLSAMRTYLASSRTLLDRDNPKDALEKIGELDDLVVRMANIIDQLKGHARESTDRLTEMDFRGAINSSLAMMTAEIEQTGVKVTTEVPKDPVIVTGDLVLLDQVIVNLIRNSLDAMADLDDKQLELRLNVDESFASLTVKDNGIGLEDLNKPFLPFFTAKSQGLGLGLAISSGIAKDLGGELTAENETPQGAVFHFRLPVNYSNQSISPE